MGQPPPPRRRRPSFPADGLRTRHARALLRSASSTPRPPASLSFFHASNPSGINLSDSMEVVP
jgi:hypothetical protein